MFGRTNLCTCQNSDNASESCRKLPVLLPGPDWDILLAGRVCSEFFQCEDILTSQNVWLMIYLDQLNSEVAERFKVFNSSQFSLKISIHCKPRAPSSKC